ncbi:hypothetical protein V8J88_21035 [Massilia sp. W12]|uniref:hypothetical protein n=1 Tax=Massilia sp. W12 TaxID=3126507 RepID=UPI0030D2105C
MKKIILLLLMFHFSAYGQTKSLCNSKEKKGQAILLDQTRKRILPEFTLGKIDATGLDQDYVYSTNKFYLLVKPSHYEFYPDCNLGICMEATRINNPCPEVAEYEVKVGINPAKFKTGAFLQEITMNFENSKSDSPARPNIQYSFKPRIEGSFLRDKSK